MLKIRFKVEEKLIKFTIYVYIHIVKQLDFITLLKGKVWNMSGTKELDIYITEPAKLGI